MGRADPASLLATDGLPLCDRAAAFVAGFAALPADRVPVLAEVLLPARFPGLPVDCLPAVAAGGFVGGARCFAAGFGGAPASPKVTISSSLSAAFGTASAIAPERIKVTAKRACGSRTTNLLMTNYFQRCLAPDQ